MGVIAVDYLENDCPIYMCAKCTAHVARADHIISKAFKGKTGTAYLFDSAVNFSSGPLENRLLMTGLHVIADIYCSRCSSNLGWRYETAFEESQKYKEGKVILELALVQKRRPLRGSLPVDPPSLGAAALRMAAEAARSAHSAVGVGGGSQEEEEEEDYE